MDENSAAFETCNCVPECNSIDDEIDFIINRMEVNDSQLLSASVLVHFSDNEILAYKRFESPGTVGLLSNIGGVLGLFLGISVLSIIETIYFFTLRFIENLMLDEK